MNITDIIEQTARAKLEALTAVDGGVSDAKKYKAVINGRPWMVKIMSGTPIKCVVYKEFAKLNCCQLAVAEMFHLFEDGTLCLIAPWIDGEGLDVALTHADEELIKDYGAQTADILKKLHSAEITYPEYHSRLTMRIENACRKVEALGLNFPMHKECVQFLREEISHCSTDKITLVHRDIRPENFIVSDGKLYLIDFDNGGPADAFCDFVYLTTMLHTEHQPFARQVLNSYFNQSPPADFWHKNLIYSTLQVMEYAIWKYELKGRQMRLQAENLILQYDGFKSTIPHWWKETN